jgi:hypothetical protein
MIRGPTFHLGAASFTIYGNTKEFLRSHGYLNEESVLHVGGSGGIGGALAGAIISFGSAREFSSHLRSSVVDTCSYTAFELVKVILCILNSE